MESRTMSPSPELRKAREKKHKKRRHCYFSSEDSTTSSSDTSSSESGESQDEKLAETERFYGVTQKDINKYDLLAELANEYANEYCNEFIPGKEIKKSILYDQITYNPVLNIMPEIN